MQFQPKALTAQQSFPRSPSSNLISTVQWSDLTQKDTVAIIQQPEGQSCAVVGGIHALNMCMRGAKAIVVSGRIRDVEELQQLDIPVSC